jgi:hypothetical protein
MIVRFCGMSGGIYSTVSATTVRCSKCFAIAIYSSKYWAWSDAAFKPLIFPVKVMTDVMIPTNLVASDI